MESGGVVILEIHTKTGETQRKACKVVYWTINSNQGKRHPASEEGLKHG